jgi:dTDP-4-amino-4,6-dideoxygalactose transaminase
MPNLNAALLVAQLEKLDLFLSKKREVAEKYKAFFKESDIIFAEEIRSAKSNYWLNSIVFENLKHRNLFLDITNSANISTRPAWTLMNKLPMFKDCQKDGLKNSIWLESRIVNIPSSPIFVIK